MTSTAADGHHDHRPGDPVVELLELTATAYAQALDAVAHHDCRSARLVLTGARDRRAAAVRARAEAQSRMAGARIVLTAHRLVRSINTVQLVSDLERLEQLLIVAARRVLAGRAHLPTELRPDVATLGRVGARRLRDLADHARHDTAYLACGRELRELHHSLARHARAPRRSDEVAGLCAALSTGVLEASRHASRAA